MWRILCKVTPLPIDKDFHFKFHHLQTTNSTIFVNWQGILRCNTRPGWLALRLGWLALRPGWLYSALAGWASGLAGWPRGGTNKRTDERTDKRTDERTENLPILQDFVPYRGRCPTRIFKKKLKEKFQKSLSPTLDTSLFKQTCFSLFAKKLS